MVFFTCSGCGESLKKNKVEKHFAICRSCEYLTCIDCSKDFYGEEYNSHTSCISEVEKYSAKGTNIKPSKGEVKQQQWMKQIDEAIATSGSSNKRVAEILISLKEFQNVPRKKNKFFNFLKNSARIRDANLGEEVWKIFSSFSEKTLETKMSDKEDQDIKTVEEKANEKSTSNSKKKLAEEIKEKAESEQDKTADSKDEVKKKSKKKVKKTKKSGDVEKEVMEEQTIVEGGEKEATNNRQKKKGNKSKKKDDLNGQGLNVGECNDEKELSTSMENPDSKKKKSKKVKKLRNTEELGDEDVAVKDGDVAQNSIDQDLQEENAGIDKVLEANKKKKSLKKKSKKHLEVQKQENGGDSKKDPTNPEKDEGGNDIKEDPKMGADRKKSENLPEKQMKLELNEEVVIERDAPELSSKKKKRKKNDKLEDSKDADDIEAKKKHTETTGSNTFNENGKHTKCDSEMEAADSDKKKKSKKRKKDVLLEVAQKGGENLVDSPASKKSKSGMKVVNDIQGQDAGKEDEGSDSPRKPKKAKIRDSSGHSVSTLASPDEDSPKKNKKGKMEEASSENEPPNSEPNSKKLAVSKFKWTKTMKKTLTDAPNNSLSRKKLRKTVLKKYREVAEDSKTEEEFDSKFLKLLNESANFIVENDTVKLKQKCK